MEFQISNRNRIVIVFIPMNKERRNDTILAGARRRIYLFGKAGRVVHDCQFPTWAFCSIRLFCDATNPRNNRHLSEKCENH